MSKHAIAPLKMPDIVPGGDTATLPTFIQVRPCDLFIDDRYQRGLSEKSITLIRKIVAEWDWRAFKSPIVARVGDELHVVDGQHTAIAAASHPGITVIPVMVVDAVEKEQRAAAFVRHNRDRIAVTPTQLHYALVEAGDDNALTIEQVCTKAGIRVLKAPPGYGRFNPGDTMAVGALRILVSKRFALGARRVLDVCAGAKMAPVSADAIKAVDELLFDPQYANSIGMDNLIATVRSMGVDHEEVVQFAAAHKVPRWKALVVVWFRNTRKIRRVA